MGGKGLREVAGQGWPVILSLSLNQCFSNSGNHHTAVIEWYW